MNVGKIYLADIANGPGCRTSVFVSGCRRHCPGCFNRETWDFGFGEPYTFETFTYILGSIRDGLSILGGEPMEPENVAEVALLVRAAKEMDKDVWLYTGFTLEELEERTDPFTRAILEDVDVLVDGPFVEAEKDISLLFRGSRNQRIIDMRKTREAMRPVLWEGT